MGNSSARTAETEELGDRLLIVGRAKSKRGQPIATDVWDATEAYWQTVTSAIAPELRRLAADTTLRSRYPVDLRTAFAADLPHLSKVRDLARQLALDSVHRAVAGDTLQAVESVEAIIPVANSLSEEPLLISQLVRIACLGIAYGTTEDIVSRILLTDQELTAIEQAFISALPPYQERMIMDRAVIGEATIGLHMIATLDPINDSELGHISALRSSGSGILFWQLAAPAAGERMVMMRYYKQLLNRSSASPRVYKALANAADDELVQDLGFFSPLAAIGAPAIGRTYEAEWRVRAQIDIARTAIAVERYRLANAGLPRTLQSLVPAYLSEVPMDYFATGEERIRYRQHGEDSFVVYSVGADGEDDLGVEMEDWWQKGDITFTVAPLSVRTGPQVLSERASASL
jgi:hypothetical protein